MSTTKLYPSAPLEPATAIEKTIEKEKNEINSFKNSGINIKELITFFEVKTNYMKKNKKYKMLTTLLKSIDTFDFKTTSTSVTLSATEIGLIVKSN